MARRVEAKPNKIKVTLRSAFRYFKSVYGTLSVLPSVVAAIDSWADILPISSAIKPVVYILTGCYVAYVFYSEIGFRAKIPVLDSAKMRTRARVHFILSFVAYGVYWLCVGYFETHLPSGALAQNALFYALASLVALSLGELTRTFAILALGSVTK